MPYQGFQEDRSPPHSKEVEKAVLGSCLQFGNEVVADVLSHLGPEMFYYETHSKLFQAILGVKEKGQEVEQDTGFEELNRAGDLEFVGAHTVATYAGEIATASNTIYLCGIVRGDWERRQVLHAIRVAEPRIHDRSIPLQETIDPIRSGVEVQVSSSCQHVSDITGSVIDEIEAAWQGKAKVGIKSQIDTINATTGGWFPGEFYVIAARPSVGKTALAILESQYAKVPCWFVSVEMTKRLIMQRLLSNHTGISTTDMREGNLTQQDYTRLQDAEKRINDFPLYIEDQLKDVERLKDEAYRMYETKNVRLVVFDYIQLLTTASKEQSRDREIAKISDTLKSIAKELDIPVIALSQLSRSVEQRGDKPVLSDLRDSGTLEQDADAVIFLHRNNNFSKIVNIRISKNRNGPLGQQDYKFDGLRGTFVEIQEDEE